MRVRNSMLFVATLMAVTALAPAADARGAKKPASTEPGTYKEWGPDIDEIEIVKSFKMADYDTVSVAKFDTSHTEVTDDKDEEIKTVLAGFTETLTEAMRDELKAKAKVEMSANAPKSSRTLIVRGKVVDISPGSRAGRYFAGFGAGAAGNKLSGEIVDAKSGAVLARFTQARRSGGTMKFAGGSNTQVMRDSIHAVGKDIAHLLDAF
ncbi:MAG: DUF4410 domain-containing protein [Acidobacteriota bacterium]